MAISEKQGRAGNAEVAKRGLCYVCKPHKSWYTHLKCCIYCSYLASVWIYLHWNILAQVSRNTTDLSHVHMEREKRGKCFSYATPLPQTSISALCQTWIRI